MDLRGFTPSPPRANPLVLADEQSWESPSADFTGVPRRLFVLCSFGAWGRGGELTLFPTYFFSTLRLKGSRIQLLLEGF